MSTPRSSATSAVASGYGDQDRISWTVSAGGRRSISGPTLATATSYTANGWKPGITTRRSPRSNTAEAVEYRSPPLARESRWARASASGSGALVAAMSSRSALNPLVSQPRIERVRCDARVHAGGVDRVELVEWLALRERAATQGAQQQVGARRFVEPRADVHLARVNRGGQTIRRLGQHRHPVGGPKALRVTSDHLAAQPELFERRALFR